MNVKLRNGDVGVLSDTHGLLRPAVLTALQGSELIIHAGDIGAPEILPQLQRLAPTIAVRGNIDTEPWASSVPVSAAVDTGSARIYVLHDLQQLDFDAAVAGFHVVISGHSHKARQFVRMGVLYLNPGSAGPRRFRLPITVARLQLRAETQLVQFIDLSEER